MTLQPIDENGTELCLDKDEYISSRLFLVVKNPLECLLPSKLSQYQLEPDKEYMEIDVEVQKMICRISLNESYISTSFPNQKCCYSNTFGCFTTLGFYASLIRELKVVAVQIDKKEWRRRIVWAQLFTLTGSQNEQSDELIAPIIQETVQNDGEVNLEDLEIFMLSFLLVLNQIPNLLTASKQPLFFPDEPEKLKSLLIENVKEFLAAFSFYLPAYVGIQKLNETINVDSVAIIVESKMINFWAPELEKLNIDIKETICTLSGIPELNIIKEGGSISSLITEWRSDLDIYKGEIRKLFKTLVALNERGDLPEQCFSRAVVAAKFEQFLHEIAKEDKITTSMVNALKHDRSSDVARRAASVPVPRNFLSEDFNAGIMEIIQSRSIQSSPKQEVSKPLAQRSREGKKYKKS